MNIDKLERANILAKSLIPKVDILLNVLSEKPNNYIISDSIYGLVNCYKEFNTKFNQLLLETKQRFQKEFNEL